MGFFTLDTFLYIFAFALGTILGYFVCISKVKPRDMVDENIYFKHRYPTKNGHTKTPDGVEIQYHLSSLDFGKTWFAIDLADFSVLGKVEDVYPWLVKDLKLHNKA